MADVPFETSGIAGIPGKGKVEDRANAHLVVRVCEKLTDFSFNPGLLPDFPEANPLEVVKKGSDKKVCFFF